MMRRMHADLEILFSNNYLSQLIVVGFNSGKYNLNAIKPYFAQRFLVSGDKMMIQKRKIKMALDKKLKVLLYKRTTSNGYIYTGTKVLGHYKIML